MSCNREKYSTISRKEMRTSVLLIGFLLLLVANLLMVFTGNRGSTAEGFTSYFLENAGGTGKEYKPMGPFDNVRLETGNKDSSWRYNSPNEALQGPAFQPGPDSLFMFKNNQCKPGCCGSSFSCSTGCVCTTPEQRNLINTRGGNRTVEDGF
jgi:hypothetical protein